MRLDKKEKLTHIQYFLETCALCGVDTDPEEYFHCTCLNDQTGSLTAEKRADLEKRVAQVTPEDTPWDLNAVQAWQFVLRLDAGRTARFREMLEMECYCRHLGHTGPCKVCRVKQVLITDAHQDRAE